MNTRLKKILIEKINKSNWWHVPPCDPEAYKQRGKFLASTFRQAEFYGRPNDTPYRVFINNPVCGFSEKEILKQLFPSKHRKLHSALLKETRNWYQQRINTDARMFQKARKLGYDAIALIGSNGKKSLEKNKKPYSMELNVLYL